MEFPILTVIFLIFSFFFFCSSAMLSRIVAILMLIIPYLYASEEMFWLTAELMNVEWRKGCLTTGGCADPRFKLTETNVASNEQVSISWSILDDFNQVRLKLSASSFPAVAITATPPSLQKKKKREKEGRKKKKNERKTNFFFSL